MKAGRPRSFCTDTALDRAMTVFWRKGYEGASLAELTEAMGISPPSLYAAFGNKEGLFLAVLARYDARRQALMDRVLNAADPGAVARLYLEGVAEFAADTEGRNPPGCLLVQSGLSCSDADIPLALAQHRAEKERALRQRFERDQEAGALPQGADPAALARYLMAVANGMCVQASAGATTKELAEVVEMALAAWPGNKPQLREGSP
ncbi:MAG: TetR/AcrR family transcriptional regulator [Alphaproteobacteria bacterium]|nr:TetR/AcrR family transcriptional regulator [Alphaproteobacteria bacterium]MDE2013822.1 TetR/AcrR family transcriptional regulator [Alphaproteobacteria bacterium]MDE2073604.1 TetR/AcrR family transcriptional regulator [Alphaproteobacteria bacterium]